MSSHVAHIVARDGSSLEVPLEPSEPPGCTLIIDGVKYHLERVSRNALTEDYRVDTDLDYSPQADPSGHCYLLAPYSE